MPIAHDVQGSGSCRLPVSILPLRAVPIAAIAPRLAFVQARIRAAQSHQFVVCATLHNVVIVNHQHQIGIPNRREAVRDHKRGAPFEQDPQSLLDYPLRRLVNARCGLIEDQDTRISQHRPRKCEQLALPLTQPTAAFAEPRLVARTQALMKSCAPTVRAACSTSASVASSRP